MKSEFCVTNSLLIKLLEVIKLVNTLFYSDLLLFKLFSSTYIRIRQIDLFRGSMIQLRYQPTICMLETTCEIIRSLLTAWHHRCSVALTVLVLECGHCPFAQKSMLKWEFLNLRTDIWYLYHYIAFTLN